ncbi:hypothetical protein [Arthrobacter sp. HLT1-20]
MSPAFSMTLPVNEFLGWRTAVKEAPETAPARRARLVKRRVQHISHVRTDYVGPTGVIKSVSAAGFRVRWDHSGATELCHPEDVVFI